MDSLLCYHAMFSLFCVHSKMVWRCIRVYSTNRKLSPAFFLCILLLYVIKSIATTISKRSKKSSHKLSSIWLLIRFCTVCVCRWVSVFVCYWHVAKTLCATRMMCSACEIRRHENNIGRQRRKRRPGARAIPLTEYKFFYNLGATATVYMINSFQSSLLSVALNWTAVVVIDIVVVVCVCLTEKLSHYVLFLKLIHAKIAQQIRTFIICRQLHAIIYKFYECISH